MRLDAVIAAIAFCSSVVCAADTASTPQDEQLQQKQNRGQPGELPAGALLGPAIPGLDQDQVPQGLAYLPERDWFLISLYRDKPSEAFLAVVDAATQRPVRHLSLRMADGQPRRFHVGGIAVDERWVWIGDGDVFRIPLAAVVEDDAQGAVEMSRQFKPICVASFVAIHDGTLWVGEFVNPPKHPGCKKKDMRDNRGVPVRAWLAGYTLDANGTPTATARDGDRLVPDLLFAIPEKSQGAAFHAGKVLMSASYGRAPENHSSLWAFDNPLAHDAKKHQASVRLGSRDVPLWFLDATESPGGIPPSLPPMAEGIAVRRDTLVVLFESAARKYEKNAAVKIDRLVSLPMTERD